jgi:hypothetical protein
MNRIGIQLLHDSKAAIVAAEKDGPIMKDGLRGRDLLSLLIKANMATDIPDSQKLSDRDVLARVYIIYILLYLLTTFSPARGSYVSRRRP